ncbi:ABC transporter ATP-binding protein [Pigmentiphaga soli]|uniref:ABC transporter ATP-binding protein n=1 Tax=Pigmentiphaga soli TaxID=1007095 RepID=A0ABP8HL27_9BURK
MASITLRNVSIDFPLYGTPNRSLKSSLISLGTGGRFAASSRKLTVIRALDDINLDIPAGCKLGLLGHNGSGKSTLLKVLAGVYAPTAGAASMTGHVASLLDVSLGMDDEASGYENILLRGVYLGIPPSAMRSRMDSIAEHSGLGEYLNLPIRTYSSGMRMRLGFAISTSVEADILLMDEWLSVGDAAFQEKASRRLEEVIAKARILVLASHQPELIERVCNRVIRLEHGRVVSDEIL